MCIRDRINRIVEELNPTFPEDRRLLEQMIRRKELVNTFASPAMQRALFEKFEMMLPGNPFVYQHRSILERDLGDGDSAVRYANKAIGSATYNRSIFENSLGFALEYQSRTKTGSERKGLIDRARKIFEKGVRDAPRNAFGYLGLNKLIRNELTKAKTGTEKSIKIAESISLLENALEQTSENSAIAGELGMMQNILGEFDQAYETVEESMKRHPNDSRIRELMIQLASKDKPEYALSIAEAGAKLDTSNWRFQRHIARLSYRLDHSADKIIGHYAAAFRFRKRDPKVLAEYGGFLIKVGKFDKASELFAEGRNLPIPSKERKTIQEIWRDSSGNPIEFNGEVKTIKGALGFVIAIPENFTAVFWRTSAFHSSLVQHQRVKFRVGFSASGPAATKIMRV